MPNKTRRALDCETYLITAGQIAPRLVCVSFAEFPQAVLNARETAQGLVGTVLGLGGNSTGITETDLFSNADSDLVPALEDSLDRALAGEIELVGQNVAFDLVTLVSNHPHLMSRVWEALEQGCIRDTLIREKLLNLADHGHLDEIYLPDGTAKKISYKLATLVHDYLGQDRSPDKGDGTLDPEQDIWRLHYDTLDGVPASQFPREAADYARQDAADTLLVCDAQDVRAGRLLEAWKDSVGDIFRSEPLHVAAHFALHLMTCWGLRVDQEERARIESLVMREMTPDRLKQIIEAGILRPGEPARAYANGAIDKATGQPKLKAAVKPSINKKKLFDVIQETCKANNIQVKMTAPTEKFPDGQIAADADFIESLAPLSPVLAEYEHYAHLGKLVSTELPAIKDVEAVFPNYNPLVETGRVSSYGGGKTTATKKPLYPSRNVQQIPRSFKLEDGTVVEPRRCYLPRTPGGVLLSCDYSFLELVTLAQTAYSLVGYSVLRDSIVRGDDPHAFMGAQLAASLDSAFMNRVGSNFDRQEIYKIFKAMETSPDPAEQKTYQLWRPFGKVVMLAVPGGMGAEKLIATARKQYKVVIKSVELARTFKNIWNQVFTEMEELLGGNGWVQKNCVDHEHSDTNGEERFFYVTHFGMLRRNCTYTSVRNGRCLQSLAAEGFKVALYNVSRACMDPAMESCLLGARPLAAIHDELLLELPDDGHAHERAYEVSRLMKAAMATVCPDVPVKADPVLMRVWSKAAKPVVVDGRLQVWEPKKMKVES